MTSNYLFAVNTSIREEILRSEQAYFLVSAVLGKHLIIFFDKKKIIGI
jgi:hypothetical protein